MRNPDRHSHSGRLLPATAAATGEFARGRLDFYACGKTRFGAIGWLKLASDWQVVAAGQGSDDGSRREEVERIRERLLRFVVAWGGVARIGTTGRFCGDECERV